MVSRILATLLILFSATAMAGPNGARLYAQNCAACHGHDGKGGVGVPLALQDFLATVDDAFLFKTLRHGRPGRVMPAFSNLSNAQIKAIISHLRSWMPPKAPALVLPSGAIKGNAQRGQALFEKNCAVCHGSNGEGGQGTGVTFSRPRDFPIMPPALNNPGFLAAASDSMIKATLMNGRKGTPMVSFLTLGLTEKDIDDLVSYVRSFERTGKTWKPPGARQPTLIVDSPYSLAETVENVKRAAMGRNFRIIREQALEEGLFPGNQVNPRQVVIYFCDFNFVNQALGRDPRVGLFLPCRVTVVEREGKVKVMAINPKYLSRIYNNDELDDACEKMSRSYAEILEEATL